MRLDTEDEHPDEESDALGISSNTAQNVQVPAGDRENDSPQANAAPESVIDAAEEH